MAAVFGQNIVKFHTKEALTDNKQLQKIVLMQNHKSHFKM